MMNRWMNCFQVAVLGAMLLLPQTEALAKKHRENKKEKERKEAPHPKHVAYEYDHYVNQNVYYNRTTRTYYWIESGRWNHGPSLPSHYTVGGETERIRIGGETPYEYHRINYERLPYTYGKKNFGKRRGPPAHAPAWGYREKFGYMYYPNCDVYYDPHAKQYAWVESGKMKIGYELPDWIKVDPYGGINIELEKAVNLENFKRVLR